MKRSAWILGMALWMGWSTSEASAQPSFTLSKSYGPIQLEDDAWTIHPPVVLESRSDDEPRCRFRLRSDDDALVVQVEIWPSSENRKSELSQVELFLAPKSSNPEAHYRFSLGPQSKVRSAFERVSLSKETPWKGAWTMTQYDTPQRSQYGFRFPFASFGRKTPEHGDVWGFNLRIWTGSQKDSEVSSAWVWPNPDTSIRLGTIAFE